MFYYYIAFVLFAIGASLGLLDALYLEEMITFYMLSILLVMTDIGLTKKIDNNVFVTKEKKKAKKKLFLNRKI
jgi:hypothetical protein